MNDFDKLSRGRIRVGSIEFIEEGAFRIKLIALGGGGVFFHLPQEDCERE